MTKDKLKFYEVDKEYVSYLKRCESKIPNIEYSTNEKFLCGILFTVNGLCYYAPISSFNKQQRTNILIKNNNGKPISSIRLSFMFPVPANKIKEKDFSKEEEKYKRLLMEEIQFCNKNIDKICNKAAYIYKAVTHKTDDLLVKNCCNFEKLEIAYKEYISMETKQHLC